MNDDDLPTTHLSDPAAMRAYAHPLRMQLVGLLRQRETLTATQAGKLLGESSGTCSFHLRQLARYGLVEEVPAPGRTKPWRATTLATSWSRKYDDPAANAAARSLSVAVVEQHARTAREWIERSASEPDAWSEAAWMSDHLIACTSQELTALRAEIWQLLEPFTRRAAADRRPGDRLVDVVSFAVPLPCPPAD